jgi:hypothetical protein
VGAGLVLEVETAVRWPAQPARPTRHERRYFLSNLSPTPAPLAALQAVRRHGAFENRRPWPRDVVLWEDACRVRAALRTCVVGLLHCRHVPNLAAAVRTFAWSPTPVILGPLGLAPT